MPEQPAAAPAPGRVPVVVPADESHWENYQEYNKTLRAWFVSFGVGGPALLLVNAALLETVRRSGYALCIIVLFLLGGVFQIVVAFLNKTASWHMYRGEGDDAYMATGKYKCWAKINDSYWIDFLLDVLTLLAFGAAIVLLVVANMSEPVAAVSPRMPL
jgi:hypothetical protein